ncbi:MAG: DUF2716 domain-containing protein [Clostridium sp.]|nr:DUF2716 domain-containing protein [Clostridium sp.]
MDYVYKEVDESEYDSVCKAVCDKLKFKPSVADSAAPFEISEKYTVYDISKLTNREIDNLDILMPKVFDRCIRKNEFIYALDWNHSCFKYNPTKEISPSSECITWTSDDEYMGGGYNGYFPNFYPKRGYYFFIVNSFKWGYLAHPWQKKVWVFGEMLIEKIEKIKRDVGFIRIQ